MCLHLSQSHSSSPRIDLFSLLLLLESALIAFYCCHHSSLLERQYRVMNWCSPVLGAKSLIVSRDHSMFSKFFAKMAALPAGLPISASEAQLD